MSRITTPFSFHSTASEIIEGINLTGRRAIVTGGASGIGIETARALAGAGASVTLAVRRPEAAEAVAAELRQSTGNDAIDIAELAWILWFSQTSISLINWGLRAP
jgi:pyruvate/2-oxoglutarate dehydrogenase complex dihydrolipoamide dehydrogenase (E3) component